MLGLEDMVRSLTMNIFRKEYDFFGENTAKIGKAAIYGRRLCSFLFRYFFAGGGLEQKQRKMVALVGGLTIVGVVTLMKHM